MKMALSMRVELCIFVFGKVFLVKQNIVQYFKILAAKDLVLFLFHLNFTNIIYMNLLNT